MRTTYHFGSLIKELDYAGYPRTGGHFLNYCLAGLFDIVTPPHRHLNNAEAVERQSELNPDVLYALDLRDSAVPFQPLQLNPGGRASHDVPTVSGRATLVLIRGPIATAYSRYRVERDRWGGITELTVDWLREEFTRFSAFYNTCLDVLEQQGERGLLVRWEDLVAGPEAMERLVAFVGLAPKLKCSFVWSMLRFGNFVRPGARTFYRSGNSAAWTGDARWLDTLSAVPDISFERLGYGTIGGYLASVESDETVSAGGPLVAGGS